MSIKQASLWASDYLNKKVTTSNISYLIQYGRINKYDNKFNTYVSKKELIDYYKSYNGTRETNWKAKLGNDLNWHLSFDNLREKDTTKHVHRLHPYKGKFIPQLVEYFLNDKTDEFKKEVYFKKGDIVLDPFCGSGTTLVQANELGMHAVGVDISAFNTMISNIKIKKIDFTNLYDEIYRITNSLKQFISSNENVKFENELLEKLNKYNYKHFPSPEFKKKINKGEINEKEYTSEKETDFLPVFDKLVNKYDLKIKQEKNDTFLDKWFTAPVRNEIDFVFERMKEVKNIRTKKILSVILSRTVRSCRATTHADLATLKEPVTRTYYCAKHGKICKPLFSIFSWWQRYTKDTMKRLAEFDQLRTDTNQICLKGDSRTIDIFSEIEKRNESFGSLLKEKKIKGVFTSPPYVGLIDYHEQHAYAYDLFGFERSDDKEIGPLFKGKGRQPRDSYVEGVSEVFKNCQKFLADDFDMFVVANDKFNLYPQIAEKAGLKIVNQFKRPVLNRTEKDKGAYSEIIFHLKSNK